MLGGEPPTDLDTGHEWRIETRHRNPHKSDKGLSLSKLRREKTKEMLCKMSFNIVDKFVTRSPVKHTRHELHHLWIPIEIREGLSIRVSPTAQDESGGRQAIRHLAQAIRTERRGHRITPTGKTVC
jgi:hypothetical protein